MDNFHSSNVLKRVEQRLRLTIESSILHAYPDRMDKLIKATEKIEMEEAELKTNNAELLEKLKDAQKLYYSERQKLLNCIKERDRMRSKLNSAREILQNNRSMVNNATWDKFNFLDQTMGVLGGDNLGTIAELDNTDEIMSELSYTLDESDMSAGGSSLRRSRRHKRAPCRFPSDKPLDAPQPKKSRSLHNTTNYKFDNVDELVATTKVVVRNNGPNPITATAVIESVPSSSKRDQHQDSPYQPPPMDPKYLPSAPPMSTISPDDNKRKRDVRRKNIVLQQDYEEYHDLLEDGDSDSDSENNEVKSSGSSEKMPLSCRTNARVHNWIQKSHIMKESCSVCLKKMKFSTIAAKCTMCKAVAHTSCKHRVPLPCVPVPVNTPTSKTLKNGRLEDYVPQTSPMVPSIIVHCVREIEARGLSEVGLYRVPGSDKEVKALKEKLIKAKGVIDLSTVCDIHTVCGCLKEFLRSLKDTLVPQEKWEKFAEAVEIRKKEQRQARLVDLVEALPRAHRETLAYIVLHLIRISMSIMCKMPVSNLSKIFGPSIVGFPNCSQHNALNEINISNKIMGELLQLPEEQWNRLLTMVSSENDRPDLIKTPSASSMGSVNQFFASHTPSTVRAARKFKFFNTP